MFLKPCILIIVALLLLASWAHANDSETSGLIAMRRERPSVTGVGIPVAQPEGDGGVGTYQVNPIYRPGTVFTWSSRLGTAMSFPNSVGAESSHANSVATQFYYDGPVGVAPGVPRVDNYEAIFYITNIVQGLIATPAQVINQSFILGISPGLDADYDEYAARYNVLFVSGMNNAPDVPPSAGSSYNGIGVGFLSQTAQSSVGPTSDGRAKPDIVAPHFCCSSFSTPQVAGTAALLLQAASQNDAGPGTSVVATNASVIKALILNGAVKMTNWTNGATRPLDARYGAGVLNMYNSDLQLRGGRHTAIATNSVTRNAAHPPTSHTNNIASLRGWDFAQIQSAANNDRVAHYYFHLPTNVGPHSATATLVWRKGSGSLTNLELFLYETTSNTLVTASTSSVDNVEHIFVPRLAPGRYDLQVLLRGSASQPRNETYGLAFDFAPVRLLAQSIGTNLVISWPASPAGYQLQSANSLFSPISWTSIAPTNSILSNGQNTVTLPTLSTAQFFRLFRP